jgi:hypothetical protein
MMGFSKVGVKGACKIASGVAPSQGFEARRAPTSDAARR